MTGPNVADIIATSATLTSAKEVLAEYAARKEHELPAPFWEGLARLKKEAVTVGDQQFAKACWCLEQIGRAQDAFSRGFNRARGEDYYGFWCDLERCELALQFLAPHYSVADDKFFGLGHVAKHVRLFQELFPYKYFLSPGMVVKEAVCSTCGATIRVRGGCEHIIGEVYDGEMCCRIVKDADLIEVSLVDTPAHKYSVAFGPEISYDYGAVRYVVRGLRSPWISWAYKERQVVESREKYPGAPRNALCPCGSGKKYKRCCLSEVTERRHMDIDFDEPPPADLPGYLPDASYIVRGMPEALRGRRGS
jgi:hypothetical protein